MLRLKYYYALLLMLLVTPAVFAGGGRGKSVGDIARRLDKPAMGIVELIRTVCLIAGVGLLVGSLVKFKQHRQNPVEVTMGNVITLFIAGIAVLALTFIPIYR